MLKLPTVRRVKVNHVKNIIRSCYSFCTWFFIKWNKRNWSSINGCGRKQYFDRTHMDSPWLISRRYSHDRNSCMESGISQNKYGCKAIRFTEANKTARKREISTHFFLSAVLVAYIVAGIVLLLGGINV